MKIRQGYVSNSSSSSFIICGNNILNILKQHLNDSRIYTIPRSLFNFDDIVIGEAISEIYRQCKNSNLAKIKTFIRCLLEQSVSEYCNYIFWNKISKRKCNCFYGDIPESDIYNKYIDNTLFGLTDKMKQFIGNYLVKKHEETKSEDHYDYYDVDDVKLEKMITKKANELYKYLRNNHNEIYYVCFGDNEGDCSGTIGGFVEYNYLGQQNINKDLNTNFTIYKSSNH